MKLVAAVILGSLLAGWTAEPVAEAKPLHIVSSILPLYSLASEIAGDRARVTNLAGGEGDAHDHQFTPRERHRLESADLILINGLRLEPWLTRAAARLTPPRTPIECSAGLDAELIFPTADRTRPNPHVWLDPLLARHLVTNILAALAAVDSAHAQDYATRAASCLKRLESLHDRIQQVLAPYRGTPIVTHHDSFAYFARRYGLRVVGVVEEIPDVDPTPRHLSALRVIIRENGVKIIFADPGASARLVSQLGRDLGVRVALLDSLEGGSVKPDAYEQGMRRNLSVLASSLKP